jgi:hypothetical protein
VRLNQGGRAGSSLPAIRPEGAGLMAGGVFSADPARSRFARVVCLLVAALGWANIAILGRSMLAENPPTAGFDLELLLTAGRRVAAGGSPYDPGAVAHGLQARDLFYSYPPFVAQALAPFAGLPTWLVLTGWCLGAGAGLVLVAALLGRAPIGRPAAAAPALSLDAALLALAAAPFFFPFTVALLFGNVDAWFPLLFGAVALALASRGVAAARSASIAGGVALALAAAVKLHPGTMAVWLAGRKPTAGTRWPYLTVIAAAMATGISILALSVLVGGLGPWRDYVNYLSLGSAADLASRVNIGPASQLALLAGDSGLARPLAFLFAGLAVVATIVVARLVSDPLESLSWAVVASLIVLPVTWYHYPVALIPVALAAWTRSRGAVRARAVSLALAAAIVVADIAIALPVALWLAVLLLFAAVRWSRPESGRGPTPATPETSKRAMNPIPEGTT